MKIDDELILHEVFGAISYIGEGIFIAGGEKMSSNALYSFHREMENTSDEVRPAQDVTAVSP